MNDRLQGCLQTVYSTGMLWIAHFLLSIKVEAAVPSIVGYAAVGHPRFHSNRPFRLQKYACLRSLPLAPQDARIAISVQLRCEVS